MRRAATWSKDIDQELKYLKAIIWFIRAYLVAHCSLSKVWSDCTDKSAIINDISRLSINSEINLEALETYNAFYRIRKKTVVILDHPNTEMNQLVGKVLRYDFTRNTYDVQLIDDHGAKIMRAFHPGYLQPAVGVRYNLQKKFKFETKRSFTITAYDSNRAGKPMNVDFDLSCFEQFLSFYNHNELVQDSNVYDTFLLLTGSTTKYKSKCQDEADKKDEQFEEGLKKHDMIDLVNETHSNLEYNHLFTLPLKKNTASLGSAGDGLGVLDRGQAPGFSASTFNEAFSIDRPVIVDETALQCLYPSQRLNDEVINLISKW